MGDVPSSFERWRLVDEADGLTAPERCILACLARLTNRDDQTWPSMARMARSGGFKTERSAQRVVRALTARGLIECVQVGGGVLSSGDGRTSTYRVHWDQLRALNPDTDAGVTAMGNGVEPAPTTPTAAPGFDASDNPDGAAREPRHAGAQTPTVRRTNPDTGAGGPSIHQNRRENMVQNHGARNGFAVMDGCPEPDGGTGREALARAGVRGANLEALAAAGVTAEIVRTEVASILSDPKVRNVPAVLFKRLSKLCGIAPVPKRPMATELALNVKRLEQLRRNHGIANGQQ